jgi:hypothetical protein
MSKVTIFKQQSVAPATRELSPLAKALATSGGFKRITISKGKFRRIMDGEVMGANPGPLNVIVVNALPKVSRGYYAAAYDPSATPTLPDCWSELGDVPAADAPKAQSAACTTCPQNIDGSGANGKGRACRFHRRVAVMLEGDETGELYSLQIPSKSLFGKGTGNSHPFESYLKFLTANNVSIDRIVTEVSFDDSFEEDVVRFTPLRHLTDEEVGTVAEAQANPMAERIVRLTAAQQDGVKEQPKPAPADKPAPTPVPITPETKQAIIDEDTTEDAVEEPKAVKSPTAKTPAKKAAPLATDLDSVLAAWGED